MSDVAVPVSPAEPQSNPPPDAPAAPDVSTPPPKGSEQDKAKDQSFSPGGSGDNGAVKIDWTRGKSGTQVGAGSFSSGVGGSSGQKRSSRQERRRRGNGNLPQPRAQASPPLSQGSNPPLPPQGHPPADPRRYTPRSARKSHIRTNSLPNEGPPPSPQRGYGGYQQQYPPQQYPHPQQYPYPQQYPTQQQVSEMGNPLVPVLGESGGPPPPGPRHAPSPYRKRKQQQHVRSASYDPNAVRAGGGTYGSFHGQQQMYPPQPPFSYGSSTPPKAAPRGAHPTDFSPRNEILALVSPMGGRTRAMSADNYMTGGGGGGRRSRSPSPSPAGRSARCPSPVARSSPPQSPMSGNRTAGLTKSLSERMPPMSPQLHLGQQQMIPGHHVTFSPQAAFTPMNAPPSPQVHMTNGHLPPRSPADAAAGGGMEENVSHGGEAEPFLSRDFGIHNGGHPEDGGHHRSHRGSLRKMHMRQKSAQLFMEDVKGEEQPIACRDALFAVFFLAHLAVIVALGVKYSADSGWAPEAADAGHGTKIILGDDDISPDAGNNLTIAYGNVIKVACMCGAFAVVVSALALGVMTIISRRMVQVALFFSIGLSFAWGTIGIGLSPQSFVPVTGIIALTVTVGYTFVVWDRVPFASSNLTAALSGVRANLGTVLVAFCFQGLALAWTIYFLFASISIYDAVKGGGLDISGKTQILLFAMLCVSYYWTFQVLLHVVHVTVAGVVGSWWFKPDGDRSICHSTVHTYFFRSVFFSFGSVCYGSLLVGPVQLLRQVGQLFRPNRDGSGLTCFHECILLVQECVTSSIDTLADSFNSWAFTYIGLYGYGFIDAGHNATMLFHKRGWTKIVTDDLISNTLFMVSLVIGGVTGCFGLLIEAVDEFAFTSIEDQTLTAFLIGVVVGLILSSVLFSIIGSSVNAVIVCFAGSPVEFEKCHPELSHDMRSAWREVWPGCMDVVDLKLAVALSV